MLNVALAIIPAGDDDGQAVFFAQPVADPAYLMVLAKCHVMRSSPYLYSFSVKAYYETEPEVLGSIQRSFQTENAHSEDVILETIDRSSLRDDIDIRLLYREIIWMADGYLRQAVLSEEFDAERIEQDFLRMIEQWKQVYLK